MSAARAIIALARERAGVLVESARREAEVISCVEREQARVQGYEDGRRDGLAEVRERLALACSTLEARAEQALEAWRNETEPLLVDLAVEIARKVVGTPNSEDRDRATRLAREALAALCASARTRVHCHPEDAAALENTIGGASSDRSYEIVIVPDGEVESPGCLVESDEGLVDARLSTQFGKLVEHLGQT